MRLMKSSSDSRLTGKHSASRSGWFGGRMTVSESRSRKVVSNSLARGGTEKAAVDLPAAQPGRDLVVLAVEEI